MLDDGQLPAAYAVSEESVRELMRFSDQPVRIQAAMMVALTVLARTCHLTGRAEAAESAMQRADAIRRLRGT